MRTTIDLAPDVLKRLRDTAHEENRPFKTIVDEVVRVGLLTRQPPQSKQPVEFPTWNFGFTPEVNLTKALALAAELEDQEIIRKMELGK